MRSASSLSREEKATLAVSLYKSGLSSRDIQTQTGIGRSSVLAYVKAAGLATEAGPRISAKMVGKPSRRLGAKLGPESRAKISAARSGKPTTLGQRRTEEQRARMSLAQQAVGAKRRVLRSQRALFRRSPVPKLTMEERVARRKAREAAKRMLRRILTMARVRKDARTEHLLGYTKSDLRAHLESQFKPGMNWSARESFHIDHIVPVADFFRRGIFDPAVINALSNLQVLTPEENRSKRDRLDWEGE